MSLLRVLFPVQRVTELSGAEVVRVIAALKQREKAGARSDWREYEPTILWCCGLVAVFALALVVLTRCG